VAKVIFRQQVIDDLNAIWAYTYDKWSEKQADRSYVSLEFACLQIGENPELGKEYEQIKSNLLGLRTGKHIIFYRAVNDQEIEIIRILHEKMDFIKRLNE